MLKTILGLCVFGFAANGFTADLKITSWGNISSDGRTHAGEVCGQVTGGSGLEKILIVCLNQKISAHFLKKTRTLLKNI